DRPDGDRPNGDQRGAGSGRPLRGAPVPKKAPSAGILGLVLAVLLIGLGLVALYDGIVLNGWARDAEPILTPVLTGSFVVGPGEITAALAALAFLVGLWLLWQSLRPSAR